MRRLLLFVVLASSSLLGQVPNGDISGQVREPDGIPAAGVRVYAETIPRQNIVSSQTDRNGLFRFQNVRTGSYRVLAVALVATVEEAGDALPVVVLSPRVAGTYFPRTTELERAGTVTVTAGAATGNVDITLAQETYPYSDFPLRVVRGKFVVEGGGVPNFSRDELDLFFSDGPENRSAMVTFLGGTGTPARASTRLESNTSSFRSVTGVIPIPASPDGVFQLLLPEGLYRVIQPAPSGKATSHSKGQYIKGMSFGTADLMKELMTVRAPVRNELVITLAKCTESTQDPWCN